MYNIVHSFILYGALDILMVYILLWLGSTIRVLRMFLPWISSTSLYVKRVSRKDVSFPGCFQETIQV